MRFTPALAFKIVRFAIDFFIPVVLYYGLRAAGVSVYLSLLAGSAVSVGSAMFTLVRQRRIDGFAAYTTTLLVASTVISLLTGSERFLLAKGAWVTGISGLWFFGSAFTSRPLTYTFTRPILEGRFHWPSDWNALWERFPRFRRMWRISSVMWAIVSIGDAVTRWIAAYTLPVDDVPAFNSLLWIVTALLMIVVTNVFYLGSGVVNPRSRLYAVSD